MEEAVARWRADTPATAGRVHLNNAGSALPPSPVLATALDYMRREAEIGGYEAEAEAEERIAAVYGHLARLVGAAPRNVAVVENATVAFAQALAAFDFQTGDRIVTTRSDYPSNQLMYLSLARRRGVEVVRAADLPEGGVDPQAVAELARHPRTKLVAVTWIPTSSGLVQDVESVGEICEAAGVPYLVDACQAVGQLPVDLGRLRCDYLAATARKFLRGPRGIGFLAVADRAIARGDFPLLVDMKGADWVEAGRFELADGARRFENWESPYALVLAMGEAARYALDEVGVERGGGRAIELAAHARERLAAIPGVRIADRGARLCAIATAAVAGRDARDLVARLRERRINVHFSTRLDGLLELGEKRVETVLRVSPHYYNTREEVDAFAEALGELLRLR